MAGDASEVGSIIGYLVLNRSDWTRGVRDTEADAARLGRLNPDIRIQSNAGAIIVQLQAVRAAEDRIGDGAKKATPPVIGLWGALAAVAPAAVPIAAVAGGALIGLLPVAAAVMLGVQGITKQMKAGALQGTQFATDVNQLKGEIAGLQQTAATGLMGGIDQALRGSSPLFKTVNTDIGMMSTQIGHVIGTGGPGLLSLLTQLNPLFVTFGNLLVRGAGEFEHWTQTSTGVSHFVTYVQAELPQVMSLLGNLVVLFAHIVQGAAPMGGVILGGLGMLVRVLDEIPINVLQVLIPLLEGAYAAFKVYAGVTYLVAIVNSALAGHQATVATTAAAVAAAEAEKAQAALASARTRVALVAGVSGALADEAAAAVASAEAQAAASAAAADAAQANALRMRTAAVESTASWTAMLGPLAAVAIGVGILTLGLGGNKHAAQDAAAAMNSYADSVKSSTDRLNEANLAQTNKNLSDDKAFAALTKLKSLNGDVGLSFNDLTAAVNGNDAQFASVIGRLQEVRKELSDRTAQKGWVDGAHDQFAAIDKLIGSLQKERDGLNSQIVSQEQLNQANELSIGVTDQQTRAAAALYHLHGTAGVAAYLAAQQAAQKNTDQTKAQTLAFQMENDAANILKGTLDALNGKRLSAADALNAFQSAMVNFQTGGTPGAGPSAAQQTAATSAAGRHQIAVEALALAQQKYNAAVAKGNPAQVAAAHLALDRAQLALTTSTNALSTAQGKLAGTAGKSAGTLDGMDAASVQLRGELNNQVHLLEQLVEADGGWQNSTAKSRAEMAQLRQQIINNAVAHGVDATAVTKYIDTLFKIPKSIPPTQLDIDTTRAKAAALAYKKWFQANLGNLRMQADLASQFVTSGGTRSKGGFIIGASAGGGTVDGPGTSKSDSIVAMLANGNGWRLSKGEEVIQEPFASQWRPLLKAINNGKLTMPSQNLPGRRRGSDGDSTIQQLMSMLAARSAGVGIEHFEQHNHYPLPETPSDSTPKVLKAAAMALDVF